MKKINYKQLIGRRLSGICSSYVRVDRLNGLGFYTAYDASLLLVSAEEEGNNKSKLIEVKGQWYENEFGGDQLNIELTDTEVVVNNISLEKPSLLNDKPSFISSPKEFRIKTLDIYGYDKEYNDKSPTVHILHFKSTTEQEALLYTEALGFGLCLTYDKQRIDFFFERNFFSKHIYPVAFY